MTTTVTHSIGTSSRDYSTISAWLAACPSNLVTADQVWKGECYNDSEFSETVSVGAITSDATRYVWLTTAAGQSFADDAGVATNPLTYDQTKGVGITIAGSYTQLLTSSSTFLLVEKLQFRKQSTGVGVVAIDLGENTTLRNFIYIQAGFNPGPSINVRSAGNVINGLIVAGHGVGLRCNNASAITFCNVTVVRVLSSGAASTGIDAGPYMVLPKVVNCAVFGFTTAFGGTIASYAAGSGNNASNAAAANIPGSGNQGSLTYSSQFINTNSDWRANPGQALEANGSRQAALTSDLDVALRPRSTTAPTIGAWEIIAAGGQPTMRRFGQITPGFGRGRPCVRIN